MVHIRGRTESEHYETIAVQRSWGRHVAAIERGLVDQAAAMCSGPGSMLDIGCESGRWAFRFHESGWKIWATEVRPETLAMARDRMPHAQLLLVEPDLAELPIPEDEIDLAVCMEVAPVVNAAWFPSELARVLRPGGVVAGTVWNKSSYRGIGAGLRNGGRSWYAHDYRRWRSTMRDAGFSLRHEEGLYWAPFSRGSDSRLVATAAWVESRLQLRRLVPWSPWVGFVAQLDR